MVNSTYDSLLGQVADIVMGQSPSGDTYNRLGDGVPLLNGPTEFGPSHPAATIWTTAPTKVCQPGDLLFCVRGSTTGRMNWADQRYCLGRGVAAIRAKTGGADTRFLYYTLVAALPRLLSRCAGSVFPNLSREDFLTFDVNWPDKQTRQDVAEILGALDDKIELNLRMNTTLEAMASSLFKSWFIDFDPVHAKAAGQQPADMDAETAAPFPSTFSPSELGLIPQGWQVANVSTVLSISREGLNPGNWPGEMFDHYSIPAYDEERLPKAESGASIKSNKFVVTKDSVLISKLNPHIPRVWLPTTSEQRRSVCSTEFLVTRPVGVASRAYVYALLSSHAFLDVFGTLVTGTSGSHQRVQAESLLNLNIVVPNGELIALFTRLAQPLYERVSHNLQESRTLLTIRDALLPKLLSGEVRARDADLAVEEALA